MPQYFKGDDDELKVYNSAAPILTALSTNKDDFYAGAFGTAPLGDLLYDTGRSPLSNAITRDIFRLAYQEIFNAFLVAGSFESYLTVFRKIFGTGVGVVFTVPAAGKLTIAISATGVDESPFVTRYISNNQYIWDYMVDHLGNQIVLQTVTGFQSQYELERMLYEMVPAGIFTTITLTLGS